jgi:Helicase conserved C-terminal domain
MGYQVIAIRAELGHEERSRLFQKFNDESDPSQVLVTSISLSRGVNLHGACHTAIVLEHDASLPGLYQTACRVNRVGQKHKQNILVLALDQSYDEYVRSRALRKYCPQYYAEHPQVLNGSPVFFRYLNYMAVMKQTLGWASIPFNVDQSSHGLRVLAREFSDLIPDILEHIQDDPQKKKTLQREFDAARAKRESLAKRASLAAKTKALVRLAMAARQNLQEVESLPGPATLVRPEELAEGQEGEVLEIDEPVDEYAATEDASEDEGSTGKSAKMREKVRNAPPGRENWRWSAPFTAGDFPTTLRKRIDSRTGDVLPGISGATWDKLHDKERNFYLRLSIDRVVEPCQAGGTEADDEVDGKVYREVDQEADDEIDREANGEIGGEPNPEVNHQPTDEANAEPTGEDTGESDGQVDDHNANGSERGRKRDREEAYIGSKEDAEGEDTRLTKVRKTAAAATSRLI